MDMDPKTVQSLEAGEPKFKSTVVKLAKALGVADFTTLLAPETDQPDGRGDTPKGDITLVFHIARSIVREAAIITLVARIAEEVDAKDDIYINDAVKNTISVHTTMSTHDALLVARAFVEGRLATRRVKLITLGLRAFDQPMNAELRGNTIILTSEHPKNVGPYFDTLFEFFTVLPWEKVIVNVAQMSFLTSGALECFIRLNKWAKRHGRKLFWSNVGEGYLADLFAITKLDKMFVVKGTLEDALRV